MTDADTERFSQLEEQGRLKTLIEALQILDPRLCRLTLLLKQKIPVIYADIGIGTRIPLQMMGEGVMRLTKLVIGIASAPGGLVLMDEVENGLHYSVMKRVWSALAAAARAADAQLFATTHSWECLTAAHAAFSESEAYDFRLQRLERLRDTDDIRAVTLDQESLQAAIEGGFEVR
jgi:AAA15 family ATPase/GTPase